MHRTTILLPLELRRKLESRAQRSGKTFSQLVREALAQFLEGGGDAWESDPFFSSQRVYRRKVPTDLSRNADDHLYGSRS